MPRRPRQMQYPEEFFHLADSFVDSSPAFIVMPTRAKALNFRFNWYNFANSIFERTRNPEKAINAAEAEICNRLYPKLITREVLIRSTEQIKADEYLGSEFLAQQPFQTTAAIELVESMRKVHSQFTTSDLWYVIIRSRSDNSDISAVKAALANRKYTPLGDLDNLIPQSTEPQVIYPAGTNSMSQLIDELYKDSDK